MAMESPAIVLLIAITSFVLLLSGSGVAVADAAPIELGVVEQTNYSDELTALVVSARKGFECAFAIANAAGGIHGRQVVMRSVEANFSIEASVPSVEKLMADHPNIVAFISSFGNEQVTAMVPPLQKHDLIHIGPVTSDFASRAAYSDTNVFNRPDPWSEMVAMATSIVHKFRLKRVAIEYTINGFFDPAFNDLYGDEMGKLMKALGVEFVYVFRLDYKLKRGLATNFSLEGELTRLMFAKPDAVISFGTPDVATVEFFVGCLTHPLAATQAPNLKFFVTEVLASAVTLAFQAANQYFNAGANPVDRIYSTFTFPLSTDTSFEVVRNYQRDMTTVFGDSWKSLIGYTAIGGYITGKLTLQLLNRTAEPLTPSAVKQTVFQTTIWEVDDITYGIYNGECSGKRDVLCRCNDGAHEISFGTIDKDYVWQALPDNKYTWPVSTCSGKSLRVTQPANYLQLYDNAAIADASKVTNLLSRLQRGKVGAENTSDAQQVTIGDVRTVGVARGDTAALDALNETVLTTTVLLGMMPPSMAAQSPWPIVGPFYPEVAASQDFARGTLLTASTAEQEIHGVFNYASSALQASSVTVVLPSAIASTLSGAVEGSAWTFGVGSGMAAFTDAATLTAALPTSGLALVGGIARDSALLTAVTAALGSRPTLRVAFFSCEFATVYTELVASDAADNTLGSRIVLPTSLPHWGSIGSNATGIVNDYHTSLQQQGLTTTAAHPLELQAFVSTRAAQIAINNVVGQTSPENFLSAWYATSLLFVDPVLPLGPYFGSDCIAGGSVDTCECNVGPRRVNVFTLEGILRGTSADPEAAHNFGSCNVGYTNQANDEGASGPGTGAIVGIAVGALLMIGGILAILIVRRGDKRDTAFAPKDTDKPFTLVFTDIQSSTSLWARVPDVMGPALDAHHSIIRKLIKQHRGYEVKTIGDAFMIAFESADDAVGLCTKLQEEFLAHDWGGDAIDETYRQMEQELLEEDPVENKDKAPTCKLPQALYEKTWNGLRVRCGIHTGIGDIKFDEITKGYDYYGNVSNTAARTEACANGGQVVMTSFALNALSKPMQTSDLGAATLRGVPMPVEMFQVNAITGRVFAPLRVERANEETAITSETGETGGADNTGDSLAASSFSLSHVSMESASTIGDSNDCGLSEGFTTMLSVLDEKACKVVLAAISEKWRIQVPHGSTTAEVNQRLNKAITKKIASVVRMKSKQKQQQLFNQAKGGSPQSPSLSQSHNMKSNDALAQSQLSDGSTRLPGATIPSPRDKYTVNE